MKNLHADIVTEIDADEKKVVLLVEWYLDDLTVRWALSRTNITFGGVVYYARAFTLSNLRMSVDNVMDTCTIEIDNVDATLDAYAQYYDFQGRMMMVKRIYLDSSGNPPSNGLIYNEVFYGEMQEPSFPEETTMSIRAQTSESLDQSVLSKYYGSRCQHRFGDDGCHQNLNDDSHYVKTGTVSSGTVSKLIAPLTEADDFWNHGEISFDQGGYTYRRRVKDFSGDGSSGEVTPDINFGVAPVNGNPFEIVKGCDLTWATCSADNVWGPSGENTEHFLGFIHIGVRRQT